MHLLEYWGIQEKFSVSGLFHCTNFTCFSFLERAHDFSVWCFLRSKYGPSVVIHIVHCRLMQLGSTIPNLPAQFARLASRFSTAAIRTDWTTSTPGEQCRTQVPISAGSGNLRPRRLLPLWCKTSVLLSIAISSATQSWWTVWPSSCWPDALPSSWGFPWPVI